MRSSTMMIMIIAIMACAVTVTHAMPSDVRYGSRGRGLISSSAAPTNCTKCDDGFECCDGDHCCPYDNPGEFMCCTADEGCCVGACCIHQSTYCCPHTSSGHPDRCCPRWTVCCVAQTEDGCCTPKGGPWRSWMGLNEPSPTYRALYDDAQVVVSPNAYVTYALFVETDKVFALTIDATTGKIISQRPVAFDNHGEMTRVFMFDQVRELFYYVEANYSRPGPPPAGGRTLTLFTVDPVTGGVKSQVVSGGAVNFPTGYYYHCQLDAIFVATQIVQGADETVVGTTIWRIDPNTARSSLVTIINSADTAAFAGWIHAISNDASQAYRLGFKDVDQQSQPGLSVTSIASSNATTKWVDNIPLPDGHNFYASCMPARNATGSFYSLATKQKSLTPGWDLVRWSVGGSATVVADLGADTSPRFFGPVAESYSCDQSLFAAAVFKDNAIHLLDAWVLVYVNLATGNVTQVDIEPEIADTWSVTGIGIPLSTTRWMTGRN